MPNENCYCEIDPDGTKDKWGIPVLRFHWKWSDYELNEARHMRESFTAILETLGGTITAPARAAAARDRVGAAAGPGAAAGAAGAQRRASAAAGAPPQAGAGARGAGTRRRQPGDNRPQLGAGGGIIHEVGCVRMGTSADNSVVNRFCQVHDAPNVFSADGGPFASHGDKNPDAHDHRARVADRRVSRGGNEEGQCLRSRDVQAITQLAAAFAAAATVDYQLAREVHAQVQAVAAGGRPRAKALSPQQFRTLERLTDLDHSGRERQARRAAGRRARVDRRAAQRERRS